MDSWEDFNARQIMTKAELRGYQPHNPENAIPYQTSGSSGVPFSFHRDKSLEAIDTAIFERAWSWVGRTDQLVLRLVSGSPKWTYYDYLRNVKPMNYRDIDDTHIEWVVKYRPFLIHGVAGAIRDLSERTIRKGLGENLKHITLYLMSEDTRSHRDALSPHFKAIYMGYGTSECRTVASQCGSGTLHVNMESTIAESMDGEIVVTNLHNRVMPFVKYGTGDKGEVVKAKKCKCGIISDAIEGLEGKVIDYHFGEGMKRPTGWWLVSPISHKYSGLVKAWRIEVVPSRKLIRVFVVPLSEDIGGFDSYIEWVEENTGYNAQLIKAESIPDWRRKLIRVVKE